MRSYDAQEVLDRIAKVANDIAFHAGVGAMETAGGLLGYLVDHPRDLEPFMNAGIGELPDDWFQQHSLTWMAMNGKVVHPEDARLARIVKKMAKAPDTGEGEPTNEPPHQTR